MEHGRVFDRTPVDEQFLWDPRGAGVNRIDRYPSDRATWHAAPHLHSPIEERGPIDLQNPVSIKFHGWPIENLLAIVRETEMYRRPRQSCLLHRMNNV